MKVFLVGLILHLLVLQVLSTPPPRCGKDKKLPWKKRMTKEGACPEKWMRHKYSCYFFYTETPLKTYFEAKKMCNELNAHLVRIESEEENNWINLQILFEDLTNVEYYLGANDMLEETTFVWESNAKPLKYTDWASGEQQSGTDHCLSIRYIDSTTKWKWVDDRCTSLKRFICEADIRCFMTPSEVTESLDTR